MKTRKVCLINPPTSRDQDELFFPMGLLVLATLLAKNDIDVEMIDFDFLLRLNPGLRESRPEFHQFALRLFASSQANVFGISAICSNFPYALDLASLLRKHYPEGKIVMGGPQPSSVAVETLENFPDVDVIVIGEGERTFLELLRTDWEVESLLKVPGLALRAAGKVVRTMPRGLIADLDELPFPDYAMVDLNQYYSLSPTLALIEAGRGCPFNCTFCSTASFWSRKYRAKSPSRILEEMERLHAGYGLSSFNLTHDNFTTSPKYVRKFSDYFIEHNRREYRWSTSARTDSLARCNPRKMRDAGCGYLFFGVDTGSPRLQEVIDKHLDLDEYKSILKETVDLGIEATVSLILGYPEETQKELEETVLLGFWSKAAGAREVQFHRLSPLAGTQIYDQHKEEFVFSEINSDFSFPVAFHGETLDCVRHFPKLFSSYFSVPAPQLDSVDLFLFTQFYYVLLKNLGLSFSWLLRKKSPLKIFKDWHQDYRKSHSNPAPQAKEIVDSFLDWI